MRCAKAWEINTSPDYEPAKAKDIDSYLDKLKTLWPNHFGIWSTLFENGKTSYYTQREASCSHRDHWYARLFGAYVDLHAFGRLLDIGCGPHGLPSYLSHYDTCLISGLEPLEATGPINFEYVRGFNQFLPWPDQAFNTVVSGTSLDHVISLERSLDEVRRVLTSDGRYSVWLASVPGAPIYDENATKVKQLTSFICFISIVHGSSRCLKSILEIEDVTVISQPGSITSFIVFLPLK